MFIFPNPEWLNSYFIGPVDTCPIAAIFLIVCTWIANKGTESAGDFNNAVVIAKLGILLFIVLVAF